MRNTKEVPSVTQMVTWKLSDALRGSADRTPDAMLSLAYCMLIDKAFGDRPTDPYRAISLCAEEPVVSDFLHESLRRARLEPGGYAYREAESRVTAEELSEFLLAEGTEALWLDAEHTTPPDVADLAVMLLGPSSGSRVCDFGCGTGAFMAKAMAAAPEVIVSGIEISANAAAKAKIRLSVPRLLTLAEEEASELPEELRRREVEACLDVGVRVGDMLALFEPAMCDLAFSSYPFGMRTSMLEPRSPFAQSAKAGGLGYRRPLSMDWVFNHMLVEATTDDGKAVAIMSAGACFNTSDAAARRFFVERGLVECVIALPPRLFPGTNAGLMAIVLSKGNTAVRMIDAGDLMDAGRRTNRLSGTALDEIAHRLREDEDGRSRSVAPEELADSGYTLSPSHYLRRELRIRDARPLGEVALGIRRGATLRASELDALAVNQATDCRYLMLSDIQDGVVSEELPYLSGIDSRLLRHCIEDGDVLLSKNGSPFKVAVAEVPEGTTLLANGNLYVIKVNRELIDPYYLAAFLGSNLGMEALSQAVVGVTIPSIPLSTLRDVPIPVPPLEEQASVVAEYQAKLDEVRVLRLRVQRAIDGVRSLFDGED